MQADLKRGNAAFRTHGVGLSVAILAIATLSLSAPDQAFAACGTVSHAAGIHAAAGGGGVHVATSRTATASAAGGGASSGCATGASAPAIHGLTTSASGRVVETGAHASRTASSVRTATTKTANAGAHMRTIRSPHHG
jgi:hypothetical protein